MKIFEIFGPADDSAFKPDFDVKDDLKFFMHNDPDFYRGDYYPFIINFKHGISNGKKYSPRVFKDLVQNAYECYKDKFNVPNLPTELDDQLVEELCDELFNNEQKNFDEGHYDDIE